MACTGERIRLGVIGAGLFARDSHLPALETLVDKFQVVAVCSRRKESAAALAALLPEPAQACDDIQGLLARDDVDAVDIAVPIEEMPAVIEMALGSGKHIFSEKPLAPDVETGRRLLSLYRSHADRVWMVAENWRYEAAYLEAAKAVQSGGIGEPLLCHWADYFLVTAENKYYGTPWRRSGTFPGGFLMDSGVHRAAVLRLILGEIAEVSAVTTLLRPDLPPVDTLCSTLRFDSGVVGTYSMTVAVQPTWSSSLYIVGKQGAVEVHRRGVTVTNAARTRTSAIADYADTHAIRAELVAFAAAILEGRPHRNTPQQALQDVAVVEALLRSAETGRRMAPERVA